MCCPHSLRFPGCSQSPVADPSRVPSDPPERPNKSFKPNLLRSANSVADKACHAVGCATQVGLTQVLGLCMTDHPIQCEICSKPIPSREFVVHLRSKHCLSPENYRSVLRLPKRIRRKLKFKIVPQSTPDSSERKGPIVHALPPGHFPEHKDNFDARPHRWEISAGAFGMGRRK